MLIEYESKIITVVFIDIVDFTRITSNIKDIDLYRLILYYNLLIEPIIIKHKGNIIKKEGDSFMISFNSAKGAILATIEIKEVLFIYNIMIYDKLSFNIRIGINTGKVLIINNDLFGETVNISSRIESICNTGEIFLSKSTLNFLDPNDFLIKYVGIFTFKGVQTKTDIYKVISVL